MKRRLVIYNEAKRHWLRQQLPAKVLHVAPDQLVVSTPRHQQLKLFAGTYLAGLLVFSLFIM